MTLTLEKGTLARASPFNSAQGSSQHEVIEIAQMADAKHLAGKPFSIGLI